MFSIRMSKNIFETTHNLQGFSGLSGAKVGMQQYINIVDPVKTMQRVFTNTCKNQSCTTRHEPPNIWR